MGTGDLKGSFANGVRDAGAGAAARRGCGTWGALRGTVLLAGMGLLALSMGGCRFQGPCLRECLGHHQACVTRASTPAALEACDAWLARCQEGC